MILAGTGHRPNKLGGYNPNLEINLAVKREIEKYLLSVKPHIKHVFSGMALGFDQILARVCINLNISFIAAIPCEGQEKVWPSAAQSEYHSILKYAAIKHTVTLGPYTPWAMQARNEFMVNQATHILAVWDGSKGGTGNCIKYAQKMNKPIINLWERIMNVHS